MTFRRILFAAIAGAAFALAGCASAERSEPARTATPYVREPQQEPAPQGRASRDAADDPSKVFEADDESPVAVSPAPAGAAKGPLLAVVRFDDGRAGPPGAADLEALAPDRAGTGQSLGTPRALDPAKLAPPRTIHSLREAAGRMGASRLLLARFMRTKTDTLLEVSLHDVASGEVLGRYGPSEPSLSIAAESLHRLVSR